ncbi:hypothetical protein Tco_1560831 [Tanacetum coccineum]
MVLQSLSLMRLPMRSILLGGGLKVLDLEEAKLTQAKGSARLKKRVKQLGNRRRSQERQGRTSIRKVGCSRRRILDEASLGSSGSAHINNSPTVDGVDSGAYTE